MTLTPHTAPHSGTATRDYNYRSLRVAAVLSSSCEGAANYSYTMMTIYEEHAEILQALGECNDPDTVADLYERAMDVERRMKAQKGPLTVLVDVAKGAGAFLAVWAMVAGAFVL